MKKMNYFMMSMLATAALTMSSCSSDNDVIDGNGGSSNEVSEFYMTLKVGGKDALNTKSTGDPKEDGTEEESTISNGTLYIYNGSSLIFKKDLGSSDWDKQPTQTTTGQTKPIKVSVNRVIEGTAYNVYFLANTSRSYNDPLSSNLRLDGSSTGGSEYAENNQFVMFNENDKDRHADHSTVTFTENNKKENTPAIASTIYLDRVVARIDAPTVSVTNIESKDGTTTTKNISDIIKGVSYDKYAVSNLNNHSYLIQNWGNDWETLLTARIGNTPYYKSYADFGDTYTAKNLDEFFTTTTQTEKNYLFENVTTDVNDATALYFSIKTELTDDAKANADFQDGTFYRYDHKLYTSIKAIMSDPDIANPFGTEEGEVTADDILAEITDANGNLIAEGTKLAAFRAKYNIDIYRGGVMYYRWAIKDDHYSNTNAYSVLRNSIYRLNVKAINDIGKDVPNGPNPDGKDPNYYMTVTVEINPWILNSQDITLQ